MEQPVIDFTTVAQAREQVLNLLAYIEYLNEQNHIGAVKLAEVYAIVSAKFPNEIGR